MKEDPPDPRRMAAGDICMLPNDRAFVLASDPRVAHFDRLELFADAQEKMVTVGDGSDFFAAGVDIALDLRQGDLLAEVLPPFLHVGHDSPEASAMRWLVEHLVEELAVLAKHAMHPPTAHLHSSP
jgi:hypothetical protein